MRIRSLLIAVIFSISAALPFTIKTEKAFAEAEYAIELSIETIELPRNWIITPKYKVKLAVSISNNPGVSYLSFIAKNTDNITDLIKGMKNYEELSFRGVGNSYFREYENVVRISTYGDDVYYDTDGIMCYIEVKIPNDAEVGDFYGVDFTTEYQREGFEFYFIKDGIRYNEENFGKLTGGGVRIVDDAPLYAVETDYSNGGNDNVSEQQDREQPVSNEENAAPNNENTDKSNERSEDNNNNSDSDNGAETTTSISATKDAEESKTTTSTSKTTSTTASTSDSKKKTTSSSEIKPETIETTGALQEITTEKTASETETKKNHIPEFVAAGILAAGVIIFLILQKLTKKK